MRNLSIKEKSGIRVAVNVHGILRDAKTGRITGEFWGHNLVPTVGLNSLAARISGTDNPATKGTVTYCAVGTDSTAAAAGNTTLNTESFRKLVSVRNSTGATAKFRTFFNTSEANVTIREIGLFGDDATVAGDSGTLFARLIVNKTKTSSETLTLDWDFTFSDT